MAKQEKKEFEPLIKSTPRSTLKDKEVTIKDTMNFERRSVVSPAVAQQTQSEKEEEAKKIDREAEIERRQRTMKTQKMSLDVLLKLDILDPFLRSTEAIEHDGKLSINDKIELLIESYVHSRLSRRQLEGYEAIYDTYLDTEL